MGSTPGAGKVAIGQDDQNQACNQAKAAAADLRAQAQDFIRQAASINVNCGDSFSCMNGVATAKEALMRQATDFQTQANDIEKSGCGTVG